MISNEKWFGASGDFYQETIDQSLRFNDGDSPYLSRTFGTATSATQGTWSCWFKRGDINARGMLWSGSNYEFIDIQADGQIVVPYLSNLGYVYTHGKFRDPTNWYNLVVTFDTPNATEADRLRIYVNGVRQAVYDSITLTQNATFQRWNVSGVTGTIGNFGYNNTIYFDGLLAECNWIDGTALDASYFGETKNGVWIPKTLSGLTYGNNGFRLTFADSSALGDDTSGNGNDFTSSGLASSDVVLDSPTNNFATLNILQTSNNASTFYFSEGNLGLNVTNNSGYRNCSATFSPMGVKGYFEFCVTTGTPNFYIGIIEDTTHPTNLDYSDTSHNYTTLVHNSGVYQNAVISSQGNKIVRGGSTYKPHNIGTISAGDVMGMAFDFTGTNRRIWFHRANTYGTSDTGVGNPSTGANPVQSETYLNSTHDYRFHFGINTGSGLQTVVFNFGQDGTFAGTKTAQGNADANGNGNFFYAVPTDFIALCSSSLSDTTLSPNQSEQADDHMNTAIYNGDNGTQSITSLNFQPDLVWIKSRNTAVSHTLNDSSRGETKTLFSNASNDEVEYSASSGNGEGITAFLGNGFTVKHSASNNQYNVSGRTYVAWNWRSGGATPTKTYKVLVVADSTDYGHGIGANKYRFYKSDNSTPFPQSAVDLDLQEGGTYTFDWSSAQSHPLRFSLTNNGTHGGGSEYTTGVVKDDSAYTTTITIQSGVASLYYYCQTHSGMGAEVRTNETHGQTNFDGNLLSVSQTNQTAGFSIVKYIGNGTNPNADGVSVGHGLSSTPEMIIHKNRDNTTAGYNYWTVWTPFHSANNMSFLSFTANNTGGWAGYNTIGNTTFSPPDTGYGNLNGDNYIVYLWHSVAGYSKISTYEMNNNSDGTYVHCGFRPKFLVTKPIDQAGSWSVYDSARDPVNDGDANMSQWENTGTESGFANSSVDFTSNGFKLRQSSDGYSNIATNTAIFMAFAEQPFKLSNAR